MLLQSLKEALTREWSGILKPLSQGRQSRFNFGVYDIETPGIDSLEFYCCGFFDGEKYWNFKTMGDFLCHVLKKEYNGWRFFAHFGGRFDVHYVFDWLRANEPDTYMEINCSGSCVISLTIRQSRNRWRFCDSYRLLEASLATITKEFAVAHQKLKGRAFTDLEYNEYDCRGLYECLEIFFNQFEICSETIASHAMRVFRSRFMRTDLYQPHREIENFVRRSYCGGRCEIYRYDSAQLNHYDVNSLYPAAMLQPVPVEYLMQSRELPDDDSKRIGFYEAIIEQPETYLPVLPARLEKLYFPVGHFKGVFTSMELRAAIEAGAKVKILQGRVFLAEPIMREFTESLFEMKKQAELEGNNGKRWIMKKCLNSLYGKWGQRREQRAFIVDDGRAGLFPLPNGLAYYLMESHAAHILPHISAAITSRARLIIHGYLTQARSWYTDTDSLFTDSTLPVSADIGAMKFEGRGGFQAYRLKEYKFADEYKIKGLPRSKNENEAERLREDRELQERYLAGYVIEYERMIGWTESVRLGEKTVRRIVRPRQRLEIRDKRARDGPVDTRPWNVKELVAA
jgi:hypothetical protein